MRLIYFKTLIETEMGFEELTEQEQIDFINKLMADHHVSYPKSKTILLKYEENLDGSLDW